MLIPLLSQGGKKVLMHIYISHKIISMTVTSVPTEYLHLVDTIRGKLLVPG